jgi:hypothetical protein
MQNWQEVKPKDFWGEIAPCEHVLQIYDNNEVFINTLSQFVGDGINSGDCTIVIATQQHIEALDLLLTEHGIHVDSLKSEDQYIAIDAEEVLSKFMVDGWPDPVKFFNTISELFNRANQKDRNVRAFGEMVAILWSKGLNGATVQLEHLWNQFCAEHQMTLFCAYPKSGFTENAEESIKEICHTHSKVIYGSTVPGSANLLYKVS